MNSNPRFSSPLTLIIFIFAPLLAWAGEPEVTTPHWTTYVTTLANVVVAASIVFLWLQTKSLASQLDQTKTQIQYVRVQIEQANTAIQSDHERSRKELALTVMREWNRDIKSDTAAAEGIVKRLSFDDCKAIIDNKMLTISLDMKGLVETCLGDVSLASDVKYETAHINVTGKATGRLRYLAIDYLNILETALVSWKLGVADRQTMEDEFEFIYHPSEKRDALSTFRTALGTEAAFPAIESFIEAIRSKRERKPVQPDSPLPRK